ncbi:MucR family transcriptional regulator [Thalassospira xianhensis]|uniref:MucR family transcriptional regulator n=1 Tax=Thalassospira xianhensis TaxID=478503 RepID=UPI000DEDD26B|nr:MucR family transcriptional regulator [Thalassospira xianhensis]
MSEITTPDTTTIVAGIVNNLIEHGAVKDASTLPDLITQISASLANAQAASVKVGPATPTTPTSSPAAPAASAPAAQATVDAIAENKRPVSETGQQPAVPIRESLTDDWIICLEDGKKLKMLKRHLNGAFGLTPEEYRAKWGLPADYPMVAPNYAKQKSNYAIQVGLGRGNSKKSRAKKAEAAN